MYRDSAVPSIENHTITPRNMHFAFSADLPRDWHSGEPGISLFYDALSLTFPEGERLFIASGKAYMDEIKNPELQQDAKRFTAQEAIHRREHAVYNKQLTQQGINVDGITRTLERMMDVILRWTPKKAQLALTCAFEHYTAQLALLILSDPRIMKGAHPFYADLWRWHALEEEEHKSVAYDIYREVMPGWRGYLRRIVVMTIAGIYLHILLFTIYFIIMAKAGQLTNFRTWGRALNHLFGRPGMWRRLVVGTLSFYRPGFHPNNHGQGLAAKWRARLNTHTEHTLENSGTLFRNSSQ